MAENMSLADRAVEAVAAVKSMADNLDMEHPERHAVRNLKDIANKVLSDAFDTAIRLSWQARDLRELAETMKPLKDGAV